MTPGELFFNLLTADDDVKAIVNTRVYPLFVPQGKAYPAVTYQLISNVGSRCDSYDRARMQLSLFAVKYGDLCELAAATRAALSGYSEGEIEIRYDNEFDQYQKDAEVFHRTQDFLFDFPNPLA
jgi:hypothetical protein